MKQTKISFAKKVVWLALGVSMLLGMAGSSKGALIFATNDTWRYFKGTSEASSPDTTAWRATNFNDSSWLTGAGGFYYENDPASATAYTGSTVLPDMFGGYTCIFMRKTFVLTNLATVSALQLNTLSDDGFIAWINGAEVARFLAVVGACQEYNHHYADRGHLFCCLPVRG